MNIRKATEKALEIHGVMYREENKRFDDIRAAIAPMDLRGTCTLMIIQKGNIQKSRRGWEPTAKELISKDWKVALWDNYGNKIQHI